LKLKLNFDLFQIDLIQIGFYNLFKSIISEDLMDFINKARWLVADVITSERVSLSNFYKRI